MEPARVIASPAAAVPTVEIIIPVRDRLDDFRSCLKALGQTDYPRRAIQVTVVDDGSAAETAGFLARQAAAGRFRLIRRDEAGGYAVAVNAGLAARSGADFSVLLHGDVQVPADWLTRLLRPLRQYPDVGIVGPLSNAAGWQGVPVVRAGAKLWPVNRLPRGEKLAAFMAHMDALWSETPAFPRVPILSGVCLMIREAVLRSVGPLDAERFPAGHGEDADFCFRAGDAGFGLMVATNSYVYHAKPPQGPDGDDLHRRGQTALAAKYSQGRVVRAARTMERNPTLKRFRERVGTITEAAGAKATAEAGTGAGEGGARQSTQTESGWHS